MSFTRSTDLYIYIWTLRYHLWMASKWVGLTRAGVEEKANNSRQLFLNKQTNEWYCRDFQKLFNTDYNRYLNRYFRSESEKCDSWHWVCLMHYKWAYKFDLPFFLFFLPHYTAHSQEDTSTFQPPRHPFLSDNSPISLRQLAHLSFTTSSIADTYFFFLIYQSILTSTVSSLATASLVSKSLATSQSRQLQHINY